MTGLSCLTFAEGERRPCVARITLILEQLVCVQVLHAAVQFLSDVFGGIRFCKSDWGAYCDPNVAGAGPMFVGLAQVVEAFEAHGDCRDAQTRDEKADASAERADCAVGGEDTFREDQY